MTKFCLVHLSTSSSLKDAFSNCRPCKRSRLLSSHEDDTPNNAYFTNELQVVSIARARATEAKLRRKSIIWDESFSLVFYPVTLNELFIRSAKQHDRKEDYINKKQKEKEDDSEEFLSVMSHFSGDGSCITDFFSVKTSLEEEIELFPELRRRSIIQELSSESKGWPFGLCTRQILLPPLPKSPSDSWTWCKRTKITHAHSSLQRSKLCKTQEIRITYPH